LEASWLSKSELDYLQVWDSKIVQEIMGWRKILNSKYLAVQLACTAAAIVNVMQHR
jgi:hypothetical protein